MTSEAIFIDVNIPMYAAGTPHRYRDPSIAILEAVVEGSLLAVIDTDIIQEILHRFGAIGLWEKGTVMAESLLALVPTILPIDEAVMARTVQLFGIYGPRSIMARDLVHLAAMEAHGISTIISTDRHFDTIAGISRIDPINF